MVHLDGLEDTNHIYRRYTDWSKIERNAKTFLNAGGKGSWVFIVFKHNEHQVDEAESYLKNGVLMSLLLRRHQESLKTVNIKHLYKLEHHMV